MSELNSMCQDPDSLAIFADDQIYRVREPGSVNPLKYSGSAASGLLFVIAGTAEIIPAEETKLMSDLLEKGLGMKLDEVLLLNLHGQAEAGFRQIRAELQFNKMLLWGIKPSQLGLQALDEKNRLKEYDGIELIYTDHLSEMIKDATLKKPLWAELQKMFKISK